MEHSATTRNVGILAHVDAGKTTLSEQMLYAGGALRSPGSVDTGTATTDRLDVERARGISVQTALASLQWKGTTVNLVDTPGHVDFSAEVERCLQTLDGAVLVISAVEGVQAQTEVLWEALRALSVPTMIFINKIDRMGSDPDRVLDEIRRTLTPLAVPLQAPENAGTDSPSPGSAWPEAPSETLDRAIFETLAETDETLLERFLEDDMPSPAELETCLVRAVSGDGVVPVFFGAALDGLGIEALLDGLIRYIPPAGGNGEAPLSALVFKIIHDADLGRLSCVRIYEGEVRNRDLVVNTTRDAEEKVTRLRKVRGGKLEETDACGPGDLVLLSGLNASRAGDVLGCGEGIPRPVKLLEPLYRVQVVPGDPDRLPELMEALAILTEEDPFLDFRFNRDTQELQIRIVGLMQTQILESMLASRFNLNVSFEQPATIYRETPCGPVEGYVEYTLPKPCWAVMTFLIEPGERGSGVSYRSRVSTDDIHIKYQREVERTLPAALEQGLYGWEVTDLKITLVNGTDHEIHSRPSDFVIATPMGIMDGLAKAGTRLLEPVLAFSISAPEEVGSRILGDLVQMRAEIESPVISGGTFRVEGLIPAATSMEYPVLLGTRSGGRARMATRFHGYRDCPEDFRAETPRRGVNPLDRAKYILAARKALS